MTPTPLTVSIDHVVLTEEQAERVATALAQSREARAKAERRVPKLCLGGRNTAGNYLNIPKELLERLVSTVQRNNGAYGCLYADGAIGFNRAYEADTNRPLAGFNEGPR